MARIETAVDPAREALVELVHGIFYQERVFSLARNDIFAARELDSRQRSFVTAAYKGIISYLVNIDEIISSFSNRAIDKIDPQVLIILRLGVWQLVFSDQIPAYSAVDESVKLVKQRYKSAAGFVNGILRKVAGQKDRLYRDFYSETKTFHLQCGLKPEIAGYFKKWFGQDRAIKICRSMKEDLGLPIRLNRLRSDKGYIKKLLSKKQIPFIDAHYIADALIILRDKAQGSISVTDLPGFKEGLYSVQDESSMLVGLVAAPEGGATVVDTCASPGGKSCHMAELMGNKGKVFSFDISERRIQLIEENIQRLGIDIIKTGVQDARKLSPSVLQNDIHRPEEGLLPEFMDQPKSTSLQVKVGQAKSGSSPENSGQAESASSSVITSQPESTSFPEIADQPENTSTPVITDEPESTSSPVLTDQTEDHLADLVLVDAPCSGLGTLRKNPDIAFRLTHEDILELYPLQKQILEEASKLVRVGGSLVYSTCTLNPMENQFRVKEFLEGAGGGLNIEGRDGRKFILEDFSDKIPQGSLLDDEEFMRGAREGMVTLYPDRHRCDGFFVAKMTRLA